MMDEKVLVILGLCFLAGMVSLGCSIQHGLESIAKAIKSGKAAK